MGAEQAVLKSAQTSAVGHKRTLAGPPGRSAPGGEADEIGAKADIAARKSTFRPDYGSRERPLNGAPQHQFELNHRAFSVHLGVNLLR